MGKRLPRLCRIHGGFDCVHSYIPPLPQINLVPGQLEQRFIEIVIAVGKVDVMLLAVVVALQYCR